MGDHFLDNADFIYSDYYEYSQETGDKKIISHKNNISNCIAYKSVSNKAIIYLHKAQ